MKSIKLAAVLTIFIALLFSCKKDKPDERVYGRWKITEYYLDGQPAFDTVVKYLDGVEYEINELNSSSASYAGGNIAIKIYGLGTTTPFILFEDMGSVGLTMAFNNTKVPAPICQYNPPLSGCFECSQVWIYKFINDNTMEWRPSNGNNHSIIYQHRLVFTRIN